MVGAGLLLMHNQMGDHFGQVLVGQAGRLSKDDRQDACPTKQGCHLLESASVSDPPLLKMSAGCDCNLFPKRSGFLLTVRSSCRGP